MRKLLFLFISIWCLTMTASANENVFSLSSYKFERGTSESIYVHMNQSEGYGGFQFDLYLPEGVTIVTKGKNKPKIYEDGPWGEDDVTLVCTLQTEGWYRFLEYKNVGADNPEPGNGYIIEMTVETSSDAPVGPAKVEFKNSRIAALGDVTVKLNDVEFEAEVTAGYSITASSSDESKGTVEIIGGGESVSAGTEVTVTANPAAGYEFVKWTYEGNEVSIENPYRFTVSENIALVANFKARIYDVKFVFGNGTEDEVKSLEFGTVIPTPETPSRTGYTFAGWDPAFEDGMTVPVDGITFTAKWTVNQYTITFDTDGGSEIAPITLDYDSEVTAPAAPTKTGYTFKGWDKELPAKMPADNLSVKALWTVNQYTITFDTDGGSEIAPITLDYDSEVTAPAAPTKTGYTFKGWDKELPAKMPAENLTVIALWTVNQYTITFDTDGGSEIAPITLDYDSEVTAPAAPTKTGYTFKGWDKELPAKMPAENLSVKALWTVNRYKLTYMVDDAEYVTMDVDYGTTIVAEEAPEKEGYTFTGWIGLPETMPDYDVTVNGEFTVNTYTLSIYLNGELYSTEEIEYGAVLKIDIPDVPEHHIFDGWSEVLPETMPAHDLAIYGTYSKDPSTGVEFTFGDESIVSVYTISGVLISKNKTWEEVKSTLGKGIYIVSGKKIVIK